MPDNEMSPYFKAHEYRPTMSGPFQCRVAQVVLGDLWPTDKTHMRWYDATLVAWSYPIDYDPEIDEEIRKPPRDQFITADTPEQLKDHLERFEWRGFNSDQEPL